MLKLCVIGSDEYDIKDLLRDIKESGLKLNDYYCNVHEGFVFIEGDNKLKGSWELNNDDNYLVDELGLDKNKIFKDNGDINKEYIIKEKNLVKWDRYIRWGIKEIKDKKIL